jgi:hypothetical protein
VVTGIEKTRAPNSDQGQRQNMRAREQAPGHKPEAEREGGDERQATKRECGPRPNDQRGAGGGGAGQQHDAAPTTEAEGKGQQDF